MSHSGNKTPALAEVPPFKQKIYTFQNVKKSHIYETVYQKLRNRLPISTKPFTYIYETVYFELCNLLKINMLKFP